MTMHFRDLAEQAAADGAITSEEILALRRAGWSDGKIRPEEAEAIFMINDQLSEPTGKWTEFFVEALGEFIINTVKPRGYVSDEQADWLIARIDHDGKTESWTELELLVRLFERARSVPQRLRDYAMTQIEREVLADRGPAHIGSGLDASGISEGEARLMRRFIFSSGSDRPAGVSRAEAEFLFRIKDSTLHQVNAPEWKRLFVQGVGNYLMGFSGSAPLSRERAAELQAFMKDRSSSVGGFFGRMGKATLNENFYGILGEVFGKKDEGPTRAERADEAREVNSIEETWLEGQIDGNGRIDEYDQALLDFLKEESGFSR